MNYLLTCGQVKTLTIASGFGELGVVGCMGSTSAGKEKLYRFTAPSTISQAELSISAGGTGIVMFYIKPASDGCNGSGWTCLTPTGATSTLNTTFTYNTALIPGAEYLLLVDNRFINETTTRIFSLASKSAYYIDQDGDGFASSFLATSCGVVPDPVGNISWQNGFPQGYLPSTEITQTALFWQDCDDNNPLVTLADRCLRFDGANDRVTIPGAFTSLQRNVFTITAKFTSANTQTSNVSVIMLGSKNGLGDFGLADRNGTLVFFNNSIVYPTSVTNIRDDICHDVALVKSKTAAGQNQVRVYYEGNLVLTKNIANVYAYTQYYLGGWTGLAATQRYWKGNIDEVGFYSTALTAAQIQAQRNAMSYTHTDLRSYYPLNQGISAGVNTGLVAATDIVAPLQTGTLTSFALTGAASNWILSPCCIAAASVPTPVHPPSVTLTAAQSTGDIVVLEPVTRVRTNCQNAGVSAQSAQATLTTLGAATISPSTPLELNNSKVSMTLYPNPTNGLLNIVANGIQDGLADVEVFDAFGKLRYREQATAQNGELHLQIHLTDVATGVYTLRVRQGETQISKTFLKE